MIDFNTHSIMSPLGAFKVAFENGKIMTLTLGEKERAPVSVVTESAAPGQEQIGQQLDEYFAGALRSFDLPIDLTAYSEFAVKVLRALQTVPFGTTVSYGELAAMSGHPGAARAVGRVVGSNRTLIIIPCHRVIGRSGKLVGYSATGGVETKRWLLDFEQKVLRTNG